MIQKKSFSRNHLWMSNSNVDESTKKNDPLEQNCSNDSADSKSKKLLVPQPLPHDFVAEKMVLNSLLNSSEAIELSLKNISTEAFYAKTHQELYKAIIFMHEKKMPVDLLTLRIFLQDNGLLHLAGGLKVLIDISSQIPNLVNLKEYLRIMKERYLRRSLIKLGFEIVNSSYATNISVESIQNDLEMKLYNLRNESQTNQISTSAEIVDEICSELKENFSQPRLPGITSGLSELDAFTQGFQKSDFIILAGRPSMGKTALALNIIRNSIKVSKLPVVFFSLEMSKQQMIYRLLSMETRIDQRRLKSGKFSRDDWLKLNTTLRILAKLPLFIDDTFSLSIQDIRSKIRKISLEQKEIGLVVIDYIQLMKNSNFQFGNRVQELSQITRSLKEVAREFNIPIIGLSQLSRNLENRPDKRPILSDLRDSGSIEQDADLVLMLHKKNQFEVDVEGIELIIAKHRNGPTGNIQLKFNKRQMRFFT